MNRLFAGLKYYLQRDLQ